MNILSIDPGIRNAAVCNLVAVLAPAPITPTISIEIKDWRLVDCRDQEKVREFERAKRAKALAVKECRSKPGRVTSAPSAPNEVALVTVEERRKRQKKVSSSPLSFSEGKLLEAQKLVDRLRKETYNKPTAISFFERFINQMPTPVPAYDRVIVERQGFCGSKISDMSNLTFGYYSARHHTTFSDLGSLFWLKFTTKEEQEEGKTNATAQSKTKACLYGIRKKRSVEAARQVCRPGGLLAVHKASGKLVNFKISDSGETDSDSMLKLIKSFQSVKKGDDLADSLLQGLAVAFELCT